MTEMAIYEVVCQVCGRSNARIHYNGLVCNGCRVFFFRAISDEVKAVCERNNDCQITYTKKRGNCFACRLRKCKEANMEAKGVGKKRLPLGLVAYFTKYDLDNTLTKIYGGMLNNGTMALRQLKNIHNTRDFVNFLSGYDSYLLARHGSSPSTAVANTNVSLTELLIYPGSVMKRTSAVCDLYSDSPLGENIPFNLMASLTRIFVASVELMCVVEEFHQLIPLDKLRLIQHNSLVLPVFLLQYEKHSKKMSDEDYRRYLLRFKMRNETVANWAKQAALMTGCLYQRIKELFVETDISEKEVILLRLVALFNPSPSLSSDGMNTAIQARMRLIHILGEHIRETNTKLTEEEVYNKVHTFLQVEKHIREVIVAILPFHIYMVLNNCDDMNTQLGYDYFIRQY